MMNVILMVMNIGRTIHLTIIEPAALKFNYVLLDVAAINQSLNTHSFASVFSEALLPSAINPSLTALH